MGCDWKTVRMDEIAKKIAMGPFGSNIKVETFVNDGIPVISGAHLRGTRVEDGDFNFVTAEHAARLKNSNVFRGDVIFTHAGNIGQVAYVPDDSKYERYVISQRQFYLRCDRAKADPAFITYFFHCPEGRHKLLANASQVGVPSISRPSSNLKEIEVSLPSLEEQRAIAGSIGSIDDRIDLLSQTNATLEAIAQALFKSWFVNFDPVHAKAEGREPEVMDAATAALFPSEFEESELGLIPKGWQSAPSESIYGIGIGKTPPRKEQHWFTDNASDVAWASIRDMGTAGVFLTSTSEFLTREAVEKFNVRMVPEGSILMSFKLTVGRVAIADLDMTTNEAIAHFKPKQGSLPQSFLYCFLKSFDMHSLSSTSSIANATNSKAIRNIPILHPGLELAQKFDAFAGPLLERIRMQQRQMLTLESLRDSILPRLISGKLRLPEVMEAFKTALA